MAVNNEIGVIQPLAKVASICHRHGCIVPYRCNASAPARVEVDVETWEADLLSISSHKLYGPKGIGALYVADDRMLGTADVDRRWSRAWPAVRNCADGARVRLWRGCGTGAVDERLADAVNG